MATRLLRLCSGEVRGGGLVVHCCGEAQGDGWVCFSGVGGEGRGGWRVAEFEEIRALFALRGKGEWVQPRLLLSYKLSCL